MSKIHHTTGDGIATCRMLAVVVSDDESAVTCRLCLRALAAVAVRIEAERDRRGDLRPAVLDGPGRSEIGAGGAMAIARSLAGEPITTGPRWGGVASAWEALVLSQAERRSIASSSSPDRFGQRGGSSSASTPTTPRETQTDLVDVEIARDAACRAMVIGPHRLTAVQVLAIAQARVVGRVVVKPGRMIGGTVVGGGRGRHRVIEQVSAEEIATETGLTRHQVGIVVRRVRAEMAPRLARKGLIPESAARRENAVEEESQMAAVAGFDLEGWKAIAPVTGCSENWCREQAKRSTDPLPVKYYAGRVVAQRAEVVAWVKRQVRDAPGGGAAA